MYVQSENFFIPSQQMYSGDKESLYLLHIFLTEANPDVMQSRADPYLMNMVTAREETM